MMDMNQRMEQILRRKEILICKRKRITACVTLLCMSLAVCVACIAWNFFQPRSTQPEQNNQHIQMTATEPVQFGYVPEAPESDVGLETPAQEATSAVVEGSALDGQQQICISYSQNDACVLMGDEAAALVRFLQELPVAELSGVFNSQAQSNEQMLDKGDFVWTMQIGDDVLQCRLMDTTLYINGVRYLLTESQHAQLLVLLQVKEEKP